MLYKLQASCPQGGLYEACIRDAPKRQRVGCVRPDDLPSFENLNKSESRNRTACQFWGRAQIVWVSTAQDLHKSQ
jgi:hypothetical protein